MVWVFGGGGVGGGWGGFGGGVGVGGVGWVGGVGGWVVVWGGRDVEATESGTRDRHDAVARRGGDAGEGGGCGGVSRIGTPCGG